MIQHAVIDAEGVYLGMFHKNAEIPAGARRLTQITECDLPVGEYYWQDVDGNVDDLGRANPFGGAFWPIDPKPYSTTRKGLR